MPLAFRNLTITPDAPVAEWPTEAVQTALDRGDLRDWRRIAAELRRDPWGRTARQVEEVLSHSRPYGAAELMDGLLEQSRRRAEGEEREEVAAEVRLAVARSGLSKAHFAARIGTSPSRLSTYLSGKVTPSAALIVRMRRLADRLSAQRIAATQAEVGPAREVTIAAGELETVLESDGGEMGVCHEPHRRLRPEERLEDVEMTRAGFRDPCTRARQP